MNAPHRRQTGLSHIEVLLAVVLVAITLVPAMEALRTGLAGTTVSRDATTLSLRAASRMDEVMAETFDTLDAAGITAGSESVATTLSDAAGTPDRRMVYVSRYDADNADGDGNAFSGAEADLLWVHVTIENAGFGVTSLKYR